MNPEAMKPFGKAIHDYYHGDKTAAVSLRRDDGFEQAIPAGVFFREPDDEIIKTALDRAGGRVLDVGAGAGVHCIYLQDRGLKVTAVDISPEACEIMRKQGVTSVYCTDINDFRPDEPYDTLLLLGRSIGMVEDLTGLDYFLDKTQQLVAPGGQILLDSAEVDSTDIPEHLAYQEAKCQTGCYRGEVRVCFIYKNLEGPFCGWLHVDRATLSDHALKAGWLSEIIVSRDDGTYLAKLTRPA